ncbi:hypothetical protein EVAR_37876_1 [Eumeta japonica]|uniref:Uncharacterized protein n=1 Tax=Eumeta variegata TaxID=151549 RepID=A0A4C1Y940_EUMVA|nr:hypothetical protein EVAR_37876_1 [Eumeta japonica]
MPDVAHKMYTSKRSGRATSCAECSSEKSARLRVTNRTSRCRTTTSRRVDGEGPGATSVAGGSREVFGVGITHPGYYPPLFSVGTTPMTKANASTESRVNICLIKNSSRYKDNIGRVPARAALSDREVAEQHRRT